MSEEYDDFYPDDYEFCDGSCQVCDEKNRCVDSPYYRPRKMSGKEKQ